MASATIQRVAVVGASGTMGPVVVEALLEHGFSVTAVTRETSNATFGAEIKVKKVTFDVASLSAAFQGQDAVVSLVGRPATGAQDILIDAAITAKVKRFIPSDFGFDNRIVGNHRVAPQMEPKLKTQQYLQKLSEEHNWFSWTSLATNLFFEWGLSTGFLGFDIANRTATIIDSGREPFSTTNLSTVGEAIALILTHPEETANKYLAISSFTTTQNEVLRIFEEETGVKWNVNHITSEEIEHLGDEKKKNADYSYYLQYLLLYTFADGANHAVVEEVRANALLGLKEEDIRGTIQALISGN